MKLQINIAALLVAGALAGCAQPSHVSETEYVPQQGGPGYGGSGAGGNVNTVPGERPPGGGGAQGSSGTSAEGGGGTGVTGSGATGAYGTGQSGSAGDTGAAGAQGGSSAGATSAAPGQQSMCGLYHRLAAARTPEERQMLIDQAFPGMTPQVQQQHLAMMQQQCQ